MKRFKLAVLPVEEQTQLLAATEVETIAANTTISRLEREITLLREYRTRLVADVVTGKLDVREAIRGLPEEEHSTSEQSDQSESSDEGALS